MTGRWSGDLGERYKQSQRVLTIGFAKLPHRAARLLPPVGQALVSARERATVVLRPFCRSRSATKFCTKTCPEPAELQDAHEVGEQHTSNIAGVLVDAAWALTRTSQSSLLAL